MAILKAHGFQFVRQRGSHILMQKPDTTNGTVTVPVPDHRELKTGVLAAVIRQSGIPRTAFEE